MVMGVSPSLRESSDESPSIVENEESVSEEVHRLCLNGLLQRKVIQVRKFQAEVGRIRPKKMTCISVGAKNVPSRAE